MKREQTADILRDLKRKCVLLAGPRQAGKTTLSQDLGLAFAYMNFDVPRDRQAIVAASWDRDAPLVIFDELHKMKKWKAWLKGVIDDTERKHALLVTGSARLETFKRGGDSLAGRYFFHRLHPFTVREVRAQVAPHRALERLMTVGGFPEPFLANDSNNARRWRRGHLDQILREDLVDLGAVRDIKSVQVLVELLLGRVGATVSLSSLAGDLQVSVPTVKHWLAVLENLYVIFAVRPYHKNVARSLLKEAKYYFYDTGAVADAATDTGAVLENVVACALLRELHLCEDRTGKRSALHFIRDKEKREVDFVAVLGNKPVLMLEVKTADDKPHRPLLHFAERLAIPAVQVVKDLSRGRTLPTHRLETAAHFLDQLQFQ